jgi:hypothetical protein
MKRSVASHVHLEQLVEGFHIDDGLFDAFALRRGGGARGFSVWLSVLMIVVGVHSGSQQQPWRSMRLPYSVPLGNDEIAMGRERRTGRERCRQKRTDGTDVR